MMKKIYIAYLVVSIISAMIVGCSGGDDEETITPTNPVKPDDNSNNNQSNGSGSDNGSGTNNGNDNNSGEAPSEVEAVDLGLSVKWANINVGATRIEDYGDFYAWGEIEPKATYIKSNYQHKKVDEYGITVESDYYKTIGNEVFIEKNDKKYVTWDISGTQYDVAHVKWGGKWRLPTYKELKELTDSCSWNWASKNNIYGYKVTGKNGNSIFLPAAGWGDNKGKTKVNEQGYYTSSTLIEKENVKEKNGWSCFYGFGFYNGKVFWEDQGRFWGSSVRPVTD